MDRNELGGLSREELLELVRRQQAELAVREATIERRDEKIRELEEALAQFRRPAKTPENSSVPPARGQKANRVEGRRRKLGPKRGHLGVAIEVVAVVAILIVGLALRGGNYPRRAAGQGSRGVSGGSVNLPARWRAMNWLG